MDDQIPCAANHIEPCLRRDDHRTDCPGDECTGCAPRPAVHGYLCRRHYEQVERAWNTHARLISLAETLGINSRAVQATASASTVAGPRVPLTALQLDLDALAREDAGDVRTEDGAVAALHWSRHVYAVAARHPDQPRKERIHRMRCPWCRRLTCIIQPPDYATGPNQIECASGTCGFTSTNQDFTEAVAHLEIRIDARTRKWLDTQRQARLDGDDRAGLAQLVDAIR